MRIRAIPMHRITVIGWHLLVLVLLVWMVTRPRDEGLHWIWVPVILSPLLVLVASLVPLSQRNRAVSYWVLAAVTIPTALGGLLSLIGPVYIISVIMLIWAARREDPAVEMVQM